MSYDLDHMFMKKKDNHVDVSLKREDQNSAISN